MCGVCTTAAMRTDLNRLQCTTLGLVLNQQVLTKRRRCTLSTRALRRRPPAAATDWCISTSRLSSTIRSTCRPIPTTTTPVRAFEDRESRRGRTCHLSRLLAARPVS